MNHENYKKQYRTKQNIKCIKRNAYDLLLASSKYSV